MSCCPPGSAPYLAADNKDKGTVRSFDGISYYHVGSGSSGLLFVPDIWGWNGGRTRALADDFARRGLNVFVPKLLAPLNGGTDGDGCPPCFDPTKQGEQLGPLFGGEWGKANVVPKLEKVVKAMKHGGVEKLACIGICYGGWVAMALSAEVKMVCGVSPHPSMHIEGMTGGNPAELAKANKCPWALFPCGEVGGPGADPDIYDPDGDLYKALEEKFPQKNETKRFTKMAHGFVTRGSINISEFNAGSGEEVKAAVQECVNDMVMFLKKHGLLKLDPSDVPLNKPKFGKVQAINPDSKHLNLMLKCVKCEDISVEGCQIWEAVLGDETGIVKFTLRNEGHAAVCKPGASLRVQNAHTQMFKGFIRVVVDKWAVLKVADAKHDFEPNGDKDASSTEYELTA